MALVAMCAARMWRAGAVANVAESPEYFQLKQVRHVPAIPPSERDEQITVVRRLRWLALSLVPSSLMMGVTTYITSEITQMSVLEVLPLAIYLLSFVLVFARRRERGQSPFVRSTLRAVPANGDCPLFIAWMLRLQPLLVILAACESYAERGRRTGDAPARLVAPRGVFRRARMVCHGQLAADRPAPSRLTEFYLWMSLGGVIGGLFNALVAPLIFHSALEYPLMMVAACMLRPQGSRKAPSAGRRIPNRDSRAGGRIA